MAVKGEKHRIMMTIKKQNRGFLKTDIFSPNTLNSVN